MVEYTLFSEKLLEPIQYEEGLKKYITEHLRVDSYKITETEFGIIPMSNHRFPVNECNIIHISSAGGQTKESRGYTFCFIQKHSAVIVQQLVSGKNQSISKQREDLIFMTVFCYIYFSTKDFQGKNIFGLVQKK